MKKILLCIIGFSLTITTLTSCNDSSSPKTPQTPEAASNLATAAEASTPAETPSEPTPPAQIPSDPAPLSADAALAMYDSWREGQDALSSYTLDGQSYQFFELFGERYYWFSAEEITSYWYNILIHAETGELLFMMTSDGEYPTTSIEPLDDWVNGVAVGSSEPAPLSADAALAMYDSWREGQDALSAYALDGQSYQFFELFGERYYWFSAEEITSYWYNILIHTETGELLFMMTSDGEYPTTSIEPLDDWVNGAAVG